MAEPKPQFIANLLVQDSTNESFLKLDDVIFSTLKRSISELSDESIYDYVDKYREDIANELFDKINDSLVDAVKVNYKLEVDGTDYYIKFFNKIENELLRKISKSDPKKFEVFCKDILNLLGGNSLVSGGPNDGGIDFHSFDLKLHKLPYISTVGSKIHVIGQAKRYQKGNHVVETELREFVGASMRRINELKLSQREKFGIFQPVILAFWTTSDFHRNAKKFAQDFGIWYLGGVALCQMALALGYDSNSFIEDIKNTESAN